MAHAVIWIIVALMFGLWTLIAWTADSVLGPLPAESKLAVNLPFFEKLHADGRQHAQQWLAQSAPAVGRQSTLDLGALFY